MPNKVDGLWIGTRARGGLIGFHATNGYFLAVNMRRAIAQDAPVSSLTGLEAKFTGIGTMTTPRRALVKWKAAMISRSQRSASSWTRGSFITTAMRPSWILTFRLSVPRLWRGTGGTGRSKIGNGCRLCQSALRIPRGGVPCTCRTLAEQAEDIRLTGRERCGSVPKQSPKAFLLEMGVVGACVSDRIQAGRGDGGAATDCPEAMIGPRSERRRRPDQVQR